MDTNSTGMRNTSRRKLLATIGIGAATGLAGCIGDEGTGEQAMLTLSSTPIHHQTPTCECCEDYVTYFDERVEPATDVKNHDDLDDVKREHDIPTDMASCHTIEIDDYFVEGHVPVPSIKKLVEEQPDAKGIAVPGMPPESSGMSGMEPVDVYLIHQDGSEELFDYDEYVDEFDGI